MKLPFLEHAEVPQAKILEYLLNPLHPAGRSKARFSARLGYGMVRREGEVDPSIDIGLPGTEGEIEMIREHDLVALRIDLAEKGLAKDDVGTVVLVVRGGYEVEFVTQTGVTVAIVGLKRGQVRPLTSREIPHTRIMKAS